MDRLADRYELGDPLGQGRSTVYRAVDTRLRRDVAIKQVQLLAGQEDSELVRTRALREAQASARLNNPAAVTVYDVVEESGSIWLVMELVDGPSLSQVVADEGPMSHQRAARIGLGVLTALEAAHQVGVVHRDVKPANVLMQGGDRVKLADFGVATIRDESRVTATGLIVGSPSYMSPEQATGGDITPATDLWALGALLFFATEGEPPFQAGSALATASAVVHGAPRPAQNPGPLSPVLAQLFSKDPAGRPRARELRATLSRIARRPRRRASKDPTLVATPPVPPVAPPSEAPPGEAPEQPVPAPSSGPPPPAAAQPPVAQWSTAAPSTPTPDAPPSAAPATDAPAAGDETSDSPEGAPAAVLPAAALAAAAAKGDADPQAAAPEPDGDAADRGEPEPDEDAAASDGNLDEPGPSAPASAAPEPVASEPVASEPAAPINEPEPPSAAERVAAEQPVSEPTAASALETVSEPAPETEPQPETEPADDRPPTAPATAPRERAAPAISPPNARAEADDDLATRPVETGSSDAPSVATGARSRRSLIAAGAVALLVAVVAVPLLANDDDDPSSGDGSTPSTQAVDDGGGDEDGGGGGGGGADEPSDATDESTTAPETTSTTAASTTSTTEPSGVPAGWTPHTDPQGMYTIGIPPGWRVDPTAEDYRVDFRDPATGTFVRVEWTTQPGPDVAADWRAQALTMPSKLRNYTEIGITPATYRDYSAALWEFTHTDDRGRPWHTGNLGMLANDKGFALMLRAPEDQWAASQPIFEQFKQSFEPT